MELGSNQLGIIIYRIFGEEFNKKFTRVNANVTLSYSKGTLLILILNPRKMLVPCDNYEIYVRYLCGNGLIITKDFNTMFRQKMELF